MTLSPSRGSARTAAGTTVIAIINTSNGASGGCVSIRLVCSTNLWLENSAYPRNYRGHFPSLNYHRRTFASSLTLLSDM